VKVRERLYAGKNFQRPYSFHRHVAKNPNVLLVRALRELGRQTTELRCGNADRWEKSLNNAVDRNKKGERSTGV